MGKPHRKFKRTKCIIVVYRLSNKEVITSRGDLRLYVDSEPWAIGQYLDSNPIAMVKRMSWGEGEDYYLNQYPNKRENQKSSDPTRVWTLSLLFCSSAVTIKPPYYETKLKFSRKVQRASFYAQHASVPSRHSYRKCHIFYSSSEHPPPSTPLPRVPKGGGEISELREAFKGLR